MNKHLPKVFLGVVISSMIVIGVSTAINQPKFDITDIAGSKANLGDTKIISQGFQSMYTNHQNTLSKDGFEVKRYKKEIPEKEYMSDIFKIDEEFFEDSYDENRIFHNGDLIGYLESEVKYISGQDTSINYKLFTKNIKTKQEQSYEFILPEKFDEGTNFNYNEYLITKGNDIYIASLVDIDTEYDEHGMNKKNGNSSLTIYKMNFENEELEKYNEVKIDSSKEGLTLNNNISFVYKNKVYFTVEKTVEDNSVESYISYYDLNKNEFSYIKEPLSLNKEKTSRYEYELYTFSIDDDKLQIIMADNKNNSNMNITQTSIDLKNNKILVKDSNYIVERLYNKSELVEVRSIDEKLHIVIREFEPKRKDRDTANSIIVLDENTKKLLYMGQYKEDPVGYSSYLILKDNEV